MSDNDEQMSTNADKDEVEAENEPSTPKDVVLKVNKTKRQLAYDAKQEAIEKFKRGELDDMYRVVHMSNGKYRCYKRKEPLTPTPINVNQIKPNKPDKQVVIEDDDEEPVVVKKGKHKAEHDPMQDVMYYNLNTQINEQLNKRLDSINQEIERLRNKNSKLKNKYKNLKQAIFVTEDDEAEQPTPQPQHHEEQQQQEQEPQPQATVIPIRRRRAGPIDFNQFF